MTSSPAVRVQTAKSTEEITTTTTTAAATGVAILASSAVSGGTVLGPAVLVFFHSSQLFGDAASLFDMACFHDLAKLG